LYGWKNISGLMKKCESIDEQAPCVHRDSPLMLSLLNSTAVTTNIPIAFVMPDKQGIFPGFGITPNSLQKLFYIPPVKKK
jgi:hypothetical protein